MGIDFHTFKFLKYASSKKRFLDTLTIGRQSVHVEPHELNYSFDDINSSSYCENLFKKYFYAHNVDSIDNSDFENASIVHDYGTPISHHLKNKYETIFDGGCLEHIYNINCALLNNILACKIGGQIIHVLPANNFCGHGFYQFSPELFFNLYSKENGFAETEIFIADISNRLNWHRVLKPNHGDRVNIYSNTSLYIMVRTIKANDSFIVNNSKIYQSDYVHQWGKKNNHNEMVSGFKKFRKIIYSYPSLFTYSFRFFKVFQLISHPLRYNNNYLKKIPIASV